MIIKILMNMQNKLYTIQFFSAPRAAIAEPRNPKFPERVSTPRQEGIRTHGNEKSRDLPAPRPSPVHKLSMMSKIWNISLGQLGYLPGCAPSQLLHTCSSAGYEKLEKVLDFVATTENTGVMN